jgi:hypothetical protein
MTTIIARRTTIGALALTLSVLSACTDDSHGATAPGGTPPDGTPSAVDVVFCNGLEPAWVAFQDGDGAWTRVQPSVTSPYTTFHLTLSANRGAVATARELVTGVPLLSIQYGAPTELAIVGDTRPDHCPSASFKTVLGTVAGLDSNEVAFVTAGYAFREVAIPVDGNTFALSPLRPGPQDILATRGTRGPRTSDNVTVTGFILRRTPELPDSATIPVLDFDSGEAFQPAVHTVTLAGLGSEAVTGQTGFRTARSENVVTFFSGRFVTHQYYSIPEARLAPGDLQSLTATTAPVANVVRGATVYFRASADRTVTFGAPPSAPEISVASTAPTVRLRAQFAPQADYDRLAVINYQQAQSIVSVGMTAAYAGLTAGGYDLVVPDLTGVQDFDPRWTLRSGAQLVWTSFRIGGTLGLGLDAVPTDGVTRRIGTDAGFLTP